MRKKYRSAITRLWSIAMPVLLAMLQSPSVNAGEDDHLAPCKAFFPEYKNRVESISLAAMPGQIEFWVTVIPSGPPESSVGISTDKGRYFVTHVVFQQSLWNRSLVSTGPTTMAYDFSTPPVRTTTRTARISAELYAALSSEWTRSIDGVGPINEKNATVRVDGVTFEFKSLGRCGSAESIDSESRNGKLFDLVMALALLADHKGSAFSAAKDVERKLRELSPP
jgi:hypothetical protein